MPAPRLSDDLARQAWNLVLECVADGFVLNGFPSAKEEAAKRAVKQGIVRTTGAFNTRVRAAMAREMHLSDGVHEAVNAAKLKAPEASSGYRHIYDDQGRKTETVHWRIPKQVADLESVVDRAKSVFSDLPKAPPIPTPKHTNSDLLTLYPCFDVHMGLKADSEETGGDDYDLKLATSDMHMAVGNVMALSPDSEAAILLIGGDFFHADDDTHQTPKSRHALDVDGRTFKVMDTGIEVVAATIERLATKHRTVHVRVMRGNHDEHSHIVLTLALAQRYRGHRRIVVEKNPRDIFMHQWGKCMIAAHHGDKQKPEKLVMTLAEICPFWSESPYRIVFTGHKHHQQSNEYPGITWEQFRAFCPPDAYGAQFAPRRAAHAITFSKQSGIATRAQDPIKRAA
jgi:predicted phosphodiesterase